MLTSLTIRTAILALLLIGILTAAAIALA